MFSSSKRRGNARDTSARSPRLSTAAASRGQQAIRSAIEPLESRLLMTTVNYIVTGNGDGAGVTHAMGTDTFTATTLRAAVTAANAQVFDSVITFNAPDFTGGAANKISLTANLVLTNNTHTYTIDNTTGKQIIIDGGGAHTDFVIGNPANTAVTAEIDNLTIQDGVATVTSPENLARDGGGIYSAGPLVLNDDTFIDNVASADFNSAGGAVWNAPGTLTINGGSFIGNSAAFGGGVYTLDTATNESPSISNATFTSNSALDNGGAVENDSLFNSTFTLANDTFTGNSSTVFAPVSSISEPGGGTLLTDVTGCTFTSNKSGTGGALFTGSQALTGHQPTTLDVSNSTFKNNDALGMLGGGIYSDDQVVSISGSTFTGNLATTGSGIYIDGLGTKTVSIDTSTFTGAQGTPVYDAAGTGAGTVSDVDTVTNSTFSNNTGPASGGIFAGGKSLTATSDVFTNDTATGGANGGAISFNGTVGTTLTINTANSAPSTFTNDSSTVGNGGAVFSTAATTSISNTTFTGDSSNHGSGGAVYNNGLASGSLSLSGDTFTNDQAVNGNGGAVLDNGGTKSSFTSTGSNFTGNTARRGGAILTNGGATSTASISGGTLSGNTATATGGGAVFAGVVTLTLTSDAFSNNQSLIGPGGAVDAPVKTLTVTGSSFANDLANNNGGGIFFVGTTGTITSSTFTDETAAIGGNGGGLDAFAVDLSLVLDSFTGDQASNIGGGVDASVSDAVNVSLTINQSTFANDSATNDGGGLFLTEPTAGASADIFNSTFNGDSTNFNAGGGIDSSIDFIGIANSTFNGDTAGTNISAGGVVGGGGLAIDDNAISGAGGSSAVVVDSTFSGNSAGLALGGGISNTVPGNTMRLSGDIVAGNTGIGGSGDNDLAGHFLGAISTFNLIGDGANETGIVTLVNHNIVGTVTNPIDPMLAPLASNGGPTQTMALLPGSPAIGAGGPFVVHDVNNIDITALDQRGDARPQAQGYDIGAYESVPATPVDHFVFVSVPASVAAGASFPVVVEALNILNVVDNTFSDTVTFTSTGATNPALPTNATFTNGVYTLNTSFTTPSAAGYTITATDTTAGSPVAPATSTPIIVTGPVVGTPTVNIGGVTVTKTTSGTFPINFPVTLTSPAPAGGVVIHYATVAGTASSGAGDYVGVPTGTLTIAAGSSSGTITVTGKGNTEVYVSKNFSVAISSVTGANLGTASATGTILGTGIVTTLPAASINDITLTPASSGLTPYTFTVSLTKAAGAGGAQITYGTVAGTASSGAGDYVGIPSAVLNIAAGATSGQITVMVKPHTGPAKTFFVDLTSAVGATIADGSGMGTIL